MDNVLLVVLVLIALLCLFVTCARSAVPAPVCPRVPEQPDYQHISQAGVCFEWPYSGDNPDRFVLSVHDATGFGSSRSFNYLEWTGPDGELRQLWPGISTVIWLSRWWSFAHEADVHVEIQACIGLDSCGELAVLDFGWPDVCEGQFRADFQWCCMQRGGCL